MAQVPLSTVLTVEARDSGIPAAIANANVMIPVPVGERVIDGLSRVGDL